MPRKKRSSNWKNPLTQFLADLREKRQMTFREIAAVAGCSVSTVHGWANGAMPCESITHIKALCEHVGIPLSVALTGSKEKAGGSFHPSSFFDQEDLFDGYAQIKLIRLIPKQSL